MLHAWCARHGTTCTTACGQIEALHCFMGRALIVQWLMLGMQDMVQHTHLGTTPAQRHKTSALLGEV